MGRPDEKEAPPPAWTVEDLANAVHLIRYAKATRGAFQIFAPWVTDAQLERLELLAAQAGRTAQGCPMPDDIAPPLPPPSPARPRAHEIAEACMAGALPSEVNRGR